MTLFRTVNGIVAWFDNAGNPINPDGSPRSGPTLAALGGADGTYPDPSFAPPAPAAPPPPIAPPPAPAASGFHNLNVYVRASSGGPVVGATVLIGRDYGNGASRTTDGAGFANFGVLNEPALDWEVAAAGFGAAFGRVAISGADVALPVTIYATSVTAPPPAPPAPTPPPAGPPPGAHTFYDLNFRVLDVERRAIAHATVTLDQDFGNGATRSTDGAGFADFGVYAGATIAWRVDAAGFATQRGVVTAAVGGLEVPVTLVAGVSAPPPIPPTTTGGLGDLTPVDSGLAGNPPAPSVAAVGFETRDGVPSFTAQSFGALDIPAFGPSPVGIFLGIVSGIVGLFKGSSGSGDISHLSNVVTNIGQLLLQTVQTVADLTSRSVHTDTQAGGLFDRILGGVLGPLINAVASLVRGGAGDLSKLFGPISDTLKNIVGKLKHLYDTWLKPIIRAIDITRQLLRVLEAFHLKFAAEADAALGRLEGKLTAPMLKTIAKVNELRNVVNRIVTLDGALQRVVLVQSHIKHAECINNVWWNSQVTSSGQYANDVVTPADQLATSAEMVQAWQDGIDGDSGPYSEGADLILAAWSAPT